MLKMKLISLAALVLGTVACEPPPVYPQTDGPRRPYPERPYHQGYGDQGNNSPNYNPPYGTQPTPPPSPPVPPGDQYPVAERTDNPNRVLSPYAPYNVIDVEGFRSGQLAKDPSNGKIFRVP